MPTGRRFRDTASRTDGDISDDPTHFLSHAWRYNYRALVAGPASFFYPPLCQRRQLCHHN